VAEELADEFADGVSFDSLAPIREPDLVIPTIARTLGLRELGERPLSERLGELLKDRELLLLLDNFEQVVEAAPRVAELLAVCPRLKVLATSREMLHLSCEWVFPVSPLALPDVEQLPEDIRALSEYEAVAFFVQRARMAKPDTEENAPVVAEICARLDGMPLAIELAAASLKLISPRKILERLRRRLRLLKGGPRDAPVRQKTLRDAIGWSYDLLGAEERLLFGRLSVFAGGYTLEAAEAVCDPGEDFSEEVLDLLASLFDKSLLNRVETEEGEGRFWMLETVKEYALERLEVAGEEEAIRRAHATHYLTLAEEARSESKGPRQTEWFDRLETEHDNLRAALSDVGSATDESMSAYKYGIRGVIPAKFRVVCNGDPIDTQAEADAHPMKLTLTKLGSTPDQDSVVESTQTGSANTGDLFRFDDTNDHYICNVGINILARGTYKITISEANGGGSHNEWFSIK
jgi:predicted ATPase